MKGQALVVVLVSTLVLIGVVMFLFSRQQTSAPATPEVIDFQIDTRVNPNDDTLQKLVDSGGSYVCSIHGGTEDGNIQVDMTQYMDGGKTRLDTATTIMGRTTRMHYIADTEYVYVWKWGLIANGIKTKYNPKDDIPQEQWDPNAPPLVAKYHCVPQKVSASQFVPPSFGIFKTRTLEELNRE